MRTLLRLTGWQLALLAKYQILTIAIGIAAAYALVLHLFPVLQTNPIVITLIFADPTGMGFIFVGALILFEKSDNTLEAQITTPLRIYNYLWAKALALLVPTIICALVIALVSYGFSFNIIPFLGSLVLTSLIFTFLGIAGAIRVKTLNQYFLLIPMFLAPAFLPALNFYGITQWSFLSLIPTQSSFNLLSSAFSGEFSTWNIAELLYLIAWVFLSEYIARRSMEKTLYR